MNIARNIKRREFIKFRGNLLDLGGFYKNKGILLKCLYNTLNTIAYHEGHISGRGREAVH